MHIASHTSLRLTPRLARLAQPRLFVQPHPVRAQASPFPCFKMGIRSYARMVRLPREVFSDMRGKIKDNDPCNFTQAKVRTPIPDYLRLVLEECCRDNPGETADYIPELANANPDRAALCLSTLDGFVYSVGDADVEYTIQSISKAFVYALTLQEHGIKGVLERVGVEPSGEAFNELSLDDENRRPLNPMINVGAMLTHTLVGPEDMTPDERFEVIRKGLSAFAGRELEVDENVFTSELKTAYRNRAIANMLRNYRIITIEPNELVHGYTRQCAINVTTRDLALMAATLGNGGVQPLTGKEVVRPDVVRQVLSVMMTCGMYNGAGDWMSTVGFPAKSGVAGGIIGALPGQVGIATFSPRLDKHGNSLRGDRMCRRLSDDMGLHIMHAPEPARSVVRRHYLLTAPDGTSTAGVLSLQGTMSFTSVERVLRIIAQRSAFSDQAVDGVVLDFRQVHSIDSVSRRMLRETVKRLRTSDFKVTLVDPHNLIGAVPKGDQVDADCICDAIYSDLTRFEGWTRSNTPDSMTR